MKVTVRNHCWHECELFPAMVPRRRHFVYLQTAIMSWIPGITYNNNLPCENSNNWFNNVKPSTTLTSNEWSVIFLECCTAAKLWVMSLKLLAKLLRLISNSRGPTFDLELIANDSHLSVPSLSWKYDTINCMAWRRRADERGEHSMTSDYSGLWGKWRGEKLQTVSHTVHFHLHYTWLKGFLN